MYRSFSDNIKRALALSKKKKGTKISPSRISKFTAHSDFLFKKKRESSWYWEIKKALGQRHQRLTFTQRTRTKNFDS